MLIKADNHKQDIALLLDKLGSTVPRDGVVHVGAHLGEEVEAYREAGFQRIVLIEANPDCCRKMTESFRMTPQVSVHNYAISDSNGTVRLHLHTSRSGDTEPASILEMKKLKEIVATLSTPRTIEVPSITLDDFMVSAGLPFKDFSLLNIDIQGAELKALAGARRFVRSIQAIIAEVALIDLYEGGAREEEILAYMTAHGFERVEAIYHTLYDNNSTFPAWGECLFVRAGQKASESMFDGQ